MGRIKNELRRRMLREVAIKMEAHMAGEDKQYGQEYKVKKWSNEVKEQRYINEDATEAFCM